MRVPGLESQDTEWRPVMGSATYTRIPATTSPSYPNVAGSLTPPQAPPATHEVTPGENLTKIVRAFLAAEGQSPSNTEVYKSVQEVAAANRLANPNLIHPGQVVDLSSLRGKNAMGERQAAKSTALPNLALPDPPRTRSAPVPRSALLDQELLSAPETPDTATGISAAPTDTLLKEKLTEEPLRISASSVAALMAAPTVKEPPVDHAIGRPGPAGGPGAMPSEAALAIQRLLNSTSNALSMLRSLVDHKDHEVRDDSGPWSAILADKARLSSEYGMRKDPFTGRMEFHDGIDLAVKRGTEITAARDGVVVYSGWKGGYGNTVILRHEDGLETVYGHASKTHVKAGETVEAGTHIADAGSSGRSTGPHLHFEVRRHGRAVNPVPYLEAPPARLASRGPQS